MARNVLAEIITVGTEIVLGDILDTNSQYISKELAAMGINTYYRSAVGDNPARLADVFNIAKVRSNLIILTGGLGPTKDDLTVKTVCDSLGVRLVQNEEALCRMREYFARINRVFTENNLSQALVPENSTVFQNEKGTAPGCALEKDGVTVIFLPGPPSEMKYMFDTSVVPFLKSYCGGIIRSHFVHIYGIGEAMMDEITADLQESQNPTVAPYAKDGESLLRVTAKAENEAECETLCRKMIDEIKRRFGFHIYSVDVDSLQQVVVDLLKKQKLTVATAESCTAGYISKRITDVPGASNVFHCGAVTYSNEMKMKLLSVDENVLKKYGAVSADVAKQMAKGVRLLSGSDIGISITGIAGPDSDGTDKPVGLSFIGLSDKNGEYVIEAHKGGKNDREYIRWCSASEALNLLRLYLLNYPKEFNANLYF